MSDSPDPAPSPASTPAPWALAALLIVAIHLPLQTASPTFHNTDAWYHAQLVRLWGTGELGQGFRWTRESVWRDRWSDKELLFHAWLWPFVAAGDAWAGDAGAVRGAKAAMLALVVLQAWLWLALLRAAAVPGALWWVVAVHGMGTPWLWRDTLVRPHVLAVTLLAAFALLYAARRWRAAAAVALVFPLAYTAFHALPVAAGLVTLTWWLWRREPAWRGVALVAGAVGVGALLHPEFPRHLGNWWVQNVELPRAASTAPAELRRDLRALELQPLTWLVGRHLWPLFALTLALPASMLALRRRARPSDEALALLALAAGFGALTMMATRFVEHWAPLTVFAAALWWRDLVRAGADGGWRARWRRPVVRGVVAVGLAGLVLLAFLPAQRVIARKRLADLAPAARWLEANAADGAPVFHAAFSDFPMLWFHNTRCTYLVAMDPVYWYAKDAGRYALWVRVARGRHDDPVTAIRDELGCAWAVVTPIRRHRRLLEQLGRDPRAREVTLPGGGARLFELRRSR